MVVALQTRLLEAVGNFLALDNSQRRVRAGLAASGQVLDAIADFVNAVVDRKPVQPTFEDGLKNQRVLEAVEESAKSHQWVKV